MKFLADENFPQPAIFSLRDAGHDVRSIAEDHASLPDEEVARFCEREQRVLLTFDKDFGDLIFQRGLQAGSAVVLFRFVPAFPKEAAVMLGSLIENRHASRRCFLRSHSGKSP